MKFETYTPPAGWFIVGTLGYHSKLEILTPYIGTKEWTAEDIIIGEKINQGNFSWWPILIKTEKAIDLLENNEAVQEYIQAKQEKEDYDRVVKGLSEAGKRGADAGKRAGDGLRMIAKVAKEYRDGMEAGFTPEEQKEKAVVREDGTKKDASCYACGYVITRWDEEGLWLEGCGKNKMCKKLLYMFDDLEFDFSHVKFAEMMADSCDYYYKKGIGSSEDA